MAMSRSRDDAFGFVRDRTVMPTAQALGLFRAALRADGTYSEEQIHELTLIALEGELRNSGLAVAPLDTTE